MEHECIHFRNCSGCEIRLDAMPELAEEARAFFQEQKLAKVSFYKGENTFWRVRSKLAVRQENQELNIGLYRKGSHQVISIPKCLVHHPNINLAIHEIKTYIEQFQIVPYDEILGIGDLRYIQSVVQRKSGKVQLVLVVNAPCFEDKRVEKIREMVLVMVNHKKELWHSIWINLNVRKDNRIFGEKLIKIWGEELFWEELLETEVCFSPISFGQANLSLFEKMLLEIKEVIPKNKRGLELYAGIGSIGLPLAADFQELSLVEISPSAKEVFLESKKKLKKEVQEKLKFYSQDAKESKTLLNEAEVLIVDPPRKGLENSILKQLVSMHSIDTLVYISCGWPSFKRDATFLLNNQWKLTRASLYHFFPGSNQIETLAVFTKQET